MGKKVTQPAATSEFSIDVSTESGYSVNITVVYPEGHGLLAITALNEAASEKYLRTILYGLRDDPEVSARLEASGLSFADDEWDED